MSERHLSLLHLHHQATTTIRKKQKGDDTGSGKTTMTYAEIIDEVTKDGILKNLSKYYEVFEESEQNELEEAI